MLARVFKDFGLYRTLSHGVTGNTPDFDSGKSRFEPWWDNPRIPFAVNGIFN
jgi:hypothetical protein